MKAGELVNFNEKSLKAMSEVGIRIGDYRHLALWNDYCALIAEGQKKTYALAVVAERYSITESTLIRVIKRFDSEV